MVLLFVAIVLSLVTRKMRLPFAVTLVIVGLVLAEVGERFPALMPVEAFSLSPDILTYIFLPTLVFETAFVLDSRLLWKNMLPVLVLSIPAVFVSAVLGAYGVHWLIGVPLGASLLFGAIITSTDSTAVATLFKELGAPKRLNILAQGENLFNDPAAVLLFQLVLATLGYSAGATLIDAGNPLLTAMVTFVVGFVGGLLVGVAAGYLCGKLIEYIEDDDMVEILLTTVVAYLSFFAADRFFHVSGIMATVGCGLMLGGWGRTKFSADNLEQSERFWAYLGFIASSLVFLMVGFYINQMWSFDKIGHIGLAVLISMVARAVSIYALMPLVNRLPGIEDADFRHQTVMVWGGFRGAMTLVLAMSLPSEFAYRNDFVILAVGVVLFSLLFQGLTLEPMIKLLGLNRATLPEQYVREGSMLTAKHRARQRIEELRKRGIFNPLAVGELEERYVEEEAEIRRNIDDLRSTGMMGSREELRYLKREYLLVEKRTYLELFHRGQLSERMLKDLQHSIELQLDYLRSGGVLPPWTLHSPLRWKIETTVLNIFDTLIPGARVTQHYRLNRIADRYEEHWGRLVSTERVLEEVTRMEKSGGASPDLLEEMRETYTRWNENARKRIDAIAEQFPEYATKVQQLMAARLCLQAEEEVIQELERLEILPDREAKSLRDEVNRKLKRLRHKPLDELRARPEELLAKVPFFRGLPKEEFNHVVPLLRPRTVLADETILREGAAGNSLYLIGRGVVRVYIGTGGVSPIPIATLLAGDFFGEMAVLTGNPRTATVAAVTHCMLYELRREDLEAVAIVCPSIQQVLEVAYQQRSDELEAPLSQR